MDDDRRHAKWNIFLGGISMKNYLKFEDLNGFNRR